MQKDLRALFSALVEALDDESEALIRGDAERLATLAARKNDLLQRLAPLAARGADIPRALAGRAKALNDRNAMLLAPRLIATRARLEALRSAGNAMTYGADGRTR